VPKYHGLSPKESLFIAHYLQSFNAAAAARAAGYSPRTAKEIGCQTLTKLHVKEAIRQAMERNRITPDRVLAEIATLAFSDVRKFYNPDGTLKPLTDLDDDTAAALASIECAEISGLDGPEGVRKTMRLWDKTKNLETLARHFTLLTDKRANGMPKTLGERLDQRTREANARLVKIRRGESTP
jgi:phage terminase small subunit